MKLNFKFKLSINTFQGCIIGFRTGKILYLGIRNKYCTVCARAKNIEPETPPHKCFKNWSGTSTAMESDIIVEGFKISISAHNLKYTKMIGDGDSSVHKKLLLQKPYGNDLVQKIECKNHLLRNFSNKLRELCGKYLNASVFNLFKILNVHLT